ncbi:MAG: tRNA 2-thiouridine(34) synthase MnmA [Kofleriaceae bacterium]|nr:tRNA 2-thiouridine(34) synthase MnmA [Kofleriaceae bacterium]
MTPSPTPPVAAPPQLRPGDGLVVVALSGGVDSATAAAALVAQGHRVVGMTMRLYDAGGTVAGTGRCCGPRDLDDARAVCRHLGIPFYVIDLADDFRRAVVDDFVEAYLDGETPNPCVKCNQHIKFTPLLERARAVGADVLVTGHYARIGRDAGGAWGLYRGADPAKDQSYFLFSMPADELGSVWFPLGGLVKDEVRAAARDAGLPNAAKAESQEICFVPDGDHAGFVAREALARGRARPAVAGAIVDGAGAVVGRHDGVHRFTVGQRRGLGNLRLAPGTDRERVYVTRVDAATGTVEVGGRDAARRDHAVVRDVRWLGPVATGAVTVQLRHRGAAVPATVAVDDGGARATVRFATPQIAAPGQAAVFYDGDRVAGGGWIAR